MPRTHNPTAKGDWVPWNAFVDASTEIHTLSNLRAKHRIALNKLRARRWHDHCCMAFSGRADIQTDALRDSGKGGRSLSHSGQSNWVRHPLSNFRLGNLNRRAREIRGAILVIDAAKLQMGSGPVVLEAVC